MIEKYTLQEFMRDRDIFEALGIVTDAIVVGRAKVTQNHFGEYVVSRGSIRKKAQTLGEVITLLVRYE